MNFEFVMSLSTKVHFFLVLFRIFRFATSETRSDFCLVKKREKKGKDIFG
jgi:hypothetical protein